MEEGQSEGLSNPAIPTFPVFLNLAGRVVVVVGGGQVGSRKAAAALAAGASVRVIDPTKATLLISQLPNSSEAVHIAESYRSDHLAGACLAFAAATPEVNARVLADAKVRGIWVNSTTDPAAGNFILPSVVRSGDLTVAISTAGAAPALARRVKEKLEAEFDAAFAEWVQVLGEVRSIVLAVVADSTHRRELLDGFADWPWLMRLRTEGAATVKAAMLEIVNVRVKT
ncbi:MAG TPA: NAD(P)-dependent oxidoreductase [Gemmata sp.]|jgi:precorrin-2 dehydrogenase/sirohydrochlorin ferrochelatase|nr:NAD(P)-dependent oxidoreductase [Gemmata sp.]